MAPLFFLGIIPWCYSRLDRAEEVPFFQCPGRNGNFGRDGPFFLLLGEPPVWAVILLVASGGCAFAFTLTARNAYTYDIVGPEGALNGLSLNQMAMQSGGVVGAVISGALIELAGAGWQYLAVGISYLGSALILLTIGQSTTTEQPQQEPVLQNLIGYVKFLRENQVIMILMCLASITEVLGFTHMTLLPVLAKEVLQVGPVGLGYLTAVRQAGGLLGLALLANLGNYRHKGFVDVFNGRRIRVGPNRVLVLFPLGVFYSRAGSGQCVCHVGRHTIQDANAIKRAQRATRTSNGLMGLEYRCSARWTPRSRRASLSLRSPRGVITQRFNTNRCDHSRGIQAT
ncbi:MAG: hypothetical protein CM1200mP27_00400 [Chloroflexota bacterium]|nr:MAG: hypothetical protein CM1200mP27_00400 [Chloroflexota bacterium]